MSAAKVEQAARALVEDLLELRRTDWIAYDAIVRELGQALQVCGLSPPDAVAPTLAQLFAAYQPSR
ncbi:MAG TPA: hypothetical protein VGF94_13405 [Kofleriaceae bacterium]